MPGVVVDNDDGDEEGEVVVEDSRSTGGHGMRSKGGRCAVQEGEEGGRGVAMEAGEGREEEGSEEVGGVVEADGGAGGGGGRLVEAVEVDVKAGDDWIRSPCLWSESLSVWP